MTTATRVTKSNPSLRLVAIFAVWLGVLVGLGAVVLKLPTCRPDHVPTLRWTDATLLSAGAVTATGIDPIHIDRSLSPTGRGVVLVLMQLGAWSWLIAGGALLITGCLRDRVFTLANVVIVGSALVVGLAALLLWPSLGLNRAVFLSVSAFSGTGYEVDSEVGGVWRLVVLGPMVVVGQLFVIVMNGRRSAWRALVLTAALLLAVGMPAWRIGEVALDHAAWLGVSHQTGFVSAASVATRWASWVALAGGAVWLAGVSWRSALLGAVGLIACRLLLVGGYAAIFSADAALAASAVANSGVGGEHISATDYPSRGGLIGLMWIGRWIPLLMLALAIRADLSRRNAIN